MNTRIAGGVVLSVVVLVGIGGAASAATMAADIEGTCPCDTRADGEAWTSHAAYVACVVSEGRQRRRDGAMRPREMRAAIRMAKHATCGDLALTMCCIYRNDNDDVGRCRTMSPEACDALDDRLSDGDGEADDIGSGSCTGNPCAF